MGSAITEVHAWRKGRGRHTEPVALSTSRNSGHRTCRGSKNSLLNAERPNERRTRSAHEGLSAGGRDGLGEGQRPPLWGWGLILGQNCVTITCPDLQAKGATIPGSYI